ncbi:uncharacterized protein LOC110458390 [Mizuhopecten yessoensis]|uniref:ADP-ribosylglycohydrolase n=1 Tax=Mizuhopecten yessoensis TaxID=6573 RepID=A0A210Q6U6_MIZYE|nr:uncharacterized protein LOC110458390 [Mizuhopecten yessoensis]OWF44409.1 hypothetical protein KP79_PYT20505 [Mizuhopecten yessoensis]
MSAILKTIRPFTKASVVTTSSFITLLLLGRIPLSDTPIKPTGQSRQGFLHKDTPRELSQAHYSIMSSKLREARKEALWGMFIADALAMPVHWYYDPNDIKDGYGGWLTGFTAPEKHHPSSILTISATDNSGRTGWGEKSKPVIGGVILHDKLKYWTSKDRSIHYHQGMKAGDSTLNSMMALQMLNTMSRLDPTGVMDDREMRGHVLEDYVSFMTTPASHNDTYAESFHRAFFKDWSSENCPPKSAPELLKWTEARYARKSKGSSDHQLVVIGSIVPAIPWVIRNSHKTESECAESAMAFIKLTHPEPGLVPYIDMYARLLHSVINGRNLTSEVNKCMVRSELGGLRKQKMIQRFVEDANRYPQGSEGQLQSCQSAVGRLGSACYIEGAMSSLLFLAAQFADNCNAGVLMNANCGGENCHRGAALGALLGAASVYQGHSIQPSLKQGLGSAKEGLLQVLEDLNKSNL